MAEKKREAEKDSDVATEDKGNGAKAAVKPKRMVAQMATEPSDIVKWVQEGREVIFMSDDLPKLDDEDLDELPLRVVRQYKEARKKAEAEVLSGIQDIETLSGNAGNKVKLRKRRGWHQTWKRPDEFEDAKGRGYVEIREPKKNEEPGKESGPVKKIMKGQGEVELIAMEVSQERYDRHVKAMTRKSRDAYMGNKQGFIDSVEEVNRRVPNKEDRLKIIDDEGDVG